MASSAPRSDAPRTGGAPAGRGFGRREGGDRPPREGGDRPPREGGDRPPRTGGDRPFGDRPYGDRPPRRDGAGGDRPPRRDGDRPPREGGGGDRPPRRDGDRPPRRDGDRPRRGRDGDEKAEWLPVTKIGRLVKSGQIKSLEEVYLYSLAVREVAIIDFFFGEDKLKDDVLQITPVQKQTRAGQRTRFKAFVVVGDHDGHVGLGVKCSKEVAAAIKGALNSAKLSIVPVRRGYWGTMIGAPHTVPSKVTGKCGSVKMRLVPAPRGSGIVAAKTPRKMLDYAGIQDVYTASSGHTATLGNFAKATFVAIAQTYQFLTPDLWAENKISADPFERYSAFLAHQGKAQKKGGEKGAQRPQRRQ